MTPARLLLVAGGLLVAAVMVGLFADGTVGTAVALALAGFAGVVVTSAAFLVVGRSEDAQRAREARRRPPDR
jgi:transketolase C-terminal domain/subunit